MSSEMRDLYQEVILDHYKHPRNFRRPKTTNREAQGSNPLCGDRISIYLEFENGKIKDIGFQGSGCAISTACASMMTEGLKGKTQSEVEMFFNQFHHLVTQGTKDLDMKALGKLAVFEGVREFPMRVKCASLAWHTLKAAMDDTHEPVSTEEEE